MILILISLKLLGQLLKQLAPSPKFSSKKAVLPVIA
jgi:Na+/phosphate symporter